VCYARIRNVDEEEAREEGCELTKYMGQEVDEILNVMGFLVHIGLERTFSEYVETWRLDCALQRWD
jgi:hypothetical protein